MLIKKRFLVVLSALSIVQFAQAKPIDKQRAKNLARQVLSGNVELIQTEEMRSTQNPAYYIFNQTEGKGFAIVSGEDKMSKQLIGYSDSGRINPQSMPIGLQALLNNYAQRVAFVRKNPSKSQDEFRTRSFAEAFGRGKSVVKPLLKTQWRQMYPFNSQIPFRDAINGGDMPVGCVATAFSQVMYYHKWPKKGKNPEGQSYFSFNQAKAEHSYSDQRSFDHFYQWDKMQLKYSEIDRNKSDLTEEQERAIGDLCVDVAYASDMFFTNQVSVTYCENAAKALETYFDYQTAYLERTHYGSTDFIARIREEISDGYPVVMSGYGVVGGHAYVLDGYDRRGFFHINWGWGGLSDGYFFIDAQNPKEIGTGGGAGGFNRDHTATFVRPNREGEKPLHYKRALSFLEDKSTPSGPAYLYAELEEQKINCYSIYFNFTDPENGHRASENSGLGWGGIGTYNGTLAAVLFDEQGKAVLDAEGKQVLAYTNLAPKGRSLSLSGSIGGQVEDLKLYVWDNGKNRPIKAIFNLEKLNLKDGNYYIKAMSKEDGSEQWEQFTNGVPLLFNYEQGKVKFLNNSDKIDIIHLAKPKNIVTPIEGGKGRLNLSLKNQNAQQLWGQLALDFVGIDKGNKHLKKRVMSTIQIATDHGAPVVEGEHLGFTPKDYIERDFVYDLKESTELIAGRYKVSIGILPVNKYNINMEDYYYQIPDNKAFGDFVITILPRTEEAAVYFLEQVELSHEDRQIADDFDIYLSDEEIKLGVELINEGYTTYEGTLHYIFEDTESGKRMELGQTAITLAGDRLLSPKKTLAVLNKSKLQKAGHRRYKLFLELEKDGKRQDIWSITRERLVFSVFNNVEEALKDDSNSLFPKEKELTELNTTALESVGQAINYYPNPVDKRLFLELNSALTEVRLYTLQGLLVRRISSKGGLLELDTQELKAGLYILQICSDKACQNYKIVVKH